MSNCSVPSCRNHRRSTTLHGQDVSYHRFPKNENIRQKWLKVIQSGKTITDNYYICSIHFLEDDFERNLQAELLSLPKKRRLKPTAVPSLYIDECNKSNFEDTIKEIDPLVTYRYCVQETPENPVAASEPGVKYNTIIQRIDNLERLNNQLLKSQEILLNSKNVSCLKGKDSESDKQLLDIGLKNPPVIIVPVENFVNDVNDVKSNSITNPEISQDMDEQKPYSKKEADEGNVRCRTCLEHMQMYYFLTDIAHVTKTIKEMIIFCVPQMASTLSDDDVICQKCLDAIQFCVKFIENCLEVEKKMQTFSRKENDSEEKSYIPNMVDYIKIDHDYISKSVPESTDEHKNLECKQPGILKSLLLNQHQQTNLDVDKNYTELNKQLFKYPNCDKIIKSDKLLVNHIINVHNKLPIDDKTKENLMGLNSNDNTCRQVEITNQKFPCSSCGRSFNTENYLLSHMRRVHGLIKRPTVESEIKMTRKYRKIGDEYICKLGKCSVPNESRYTLHFKKHSESQLDICRVCGLKFHDKQELIEHRRQHGIICSICFKGFSTREEINEHRKTHPDLFFCKICGKGFKMKRSLTSHAEVHGAYCFYCSECGKGFKSNSALRYHKIIHDPEKKLKCDKCPSTFQDKTKLNLHQRVVHEKIREYKCIKCDKKFGLKTGLRSHNRLTHLKLKIYQCENCGKRFGRRDYLKIHTDHHCNESKVYIRNDGNTDGPVKNLASGEREHTLR